MLGQGWEAQWRRVQRRLEDMRDVYAETPSAGTEAAFDSVLSFFEAIHHLRDHLSKDPASGVTFMDGRALIRSSLALKLCADLANASKHLILTKTPWSGDPSTAITRNDANVMLSSGTVAHRFYMESGGRTYDALQVAEDGVAAWTRFLSSRGLI
jgi:hypothetical protein